MKVLQSKVGSDGGSALETRAIQVSVMQSYMHLACKVQLCGSMHAKADFSIVTIILPGHSMHT